MVIYVTVKSGAVVDVFGDEVPNLQVVIRDLDAIDSGEADDCLTPEYEPEKTY